MPSVNLRQLRDTRQIKLWLQAGKSVELRERDRVIGHIVPDKTPAAPQVWPDFASRAQKIFGNCVLPGADLVIEERGRY